MATATLGIVDPKEWLSRTSLLLSRTRSPTLLKVDEAYANYYSLRSEPNQLALHRALNDYLIEKGRNWEKVSVQCYAARAGSEERSREADTGVPSRLAVLMAKRSHQYSMGEDCSRRCSEHRGRNDRLASGEQLWSGTVSAGSRNNREEHSRQHRGHGARQRRADGGQAGLGPEGRRSPQS
jgi:hypothetical protein